MKSYWQNYIGGKWLDGVNGGRIAIEDPATAAPFAQIARAEPVDVDRAVQAARECVESRALLDLRPAKRSRMLLEVAAYLRERAAEIGRVLTLESGIQLEEGRAEIESTARYFEYYGGLADKIEGRYIPLGADFVDYTIPEPYGVSAHIVPWNFPPDIAARGMAPALAAGNAVVIKSPELDPLAVTYLAQACEAAGFPPGAVNIVCGYGHDAGAALANHPGVDQIVFTGSVATGRAVAIAAAQRLIPAVLELGGKSAGIVLPDADLEQVAESVKWGIFYFAGQVCSAQSRLLVHRSIHDRTVQRLRDVVAQLSIGPGVENHFLTPVICAQQLARVQELVSSGVAQGATAATGGSRAEGYPGYVMQPTLLVDAAPGMRVMREEIFGPVLSICVFDTLEEAVCIANGTNFGLCAGVYTKDLDKAHWLAARLVAGQVFINQWFVGGVETPFGGSRQSGIGREKGQEAIRSYIRTKNVGMRIVAPRGAWSAPE
ncbi:MAG TPA: aldehyde dehydrogenase family protein [Steroidobacteraceae bacterium]